MRRRERVAEKTLAMEALRSALKSQYHASLAMLRDAIRRCPEDLWTSRGRHSVPFWQIAYHALYYTHLYLQPNSRVFRPWEHHQRGIQHMDKPLRARHPYTRSQLLAYWSVCRAMVDESVDALDLARPRSGFSWYAVPKLEHQLINLRHLQYHQAQLADRLRAATGSGVDWASARRTRRVR